MTALEPGLTSSELRDHVTGTDKVELDGMFDAITALGADEVADVIAFIASRPANVNLARVELVPTMQA